MTLVREANVSSAIALALSPIKVETNLIKMCDALNDQLIQFNLVCSATNQSFSDRPNRARLALLCGEPNEPSMKPLSMPVCSIGSFQSWWSRWALRVSSESLKVSHSEKRTPSFSSFSICSKTRKSSQSE